MKSKIHLFANGERKAWTKKKPNKNRRKIKKLCRNIERNEMNWNKMKWNEINGKQSRQLRIWNEWNNKWQKCLNFQCKHIHGLPWNNCMFSCFRVHVRYPSWLWMCVLYMTCYVMFLCCVCLYVWAFICDFVSVWMR